MFSIGLFLQWICTIQAPVRTSDVPPLTPPTGILCDIFHYSMLKFFMKVVLVQFTYKTNWHSMNRVVLFCWRLLVKSDSL